MRRLLLLLIALLLLPSLEQTSAPASASAVAAEGRKPLLATIGSGPTSQLFFADPVSLQRVGTRSLRIGFNWGDFSLSPDGSLLALSPNDAPELRFVRLDRLRFVGSMTFPRGYVDLLAWPSPRTLLGLVETAPRRVLAIDPSARKVLWKRSIRGAVLDVERSREGIVMLVAPAERIGRASIVTIGIDGSLRSVALARVSAGSERDQSSADVVETRLPGLAVDRDSSRAYVVGEGHPVAQVDLTSMRVTYHGGSRWLAKAVSGPQRQVIWLGNGKLAVVGSEWGVRTDQQGNVRQTITPSGLLLVDTRTWTTRLLHADATTATLIGGSLLAYDSSSNSAPNAGRGSGLTIYGLDGTRRAHLFGRRPINSVEAHGGLAYVWLPDRTGHVVVVDPKSRRILASVTRPSIALLTRR